MGVFNPHLEPGYYEVGSFGIRLETLVTVVKANTKVILHLLYFYRRSYISVAHIWHKNVLGYRSTAPSPITNKIGLQLKHYAHPLVNIWRIPGRKKLCEGSELLPLKCGGS